MAKAREPAPSAKLLWMELTLALFVDDLHVQNVLVDDKGDLLIFDPVIYLAKSPK